MQRSRRGFLSALLAAGVAATPNFARACAFDGIFDGSFGYIHPRAIEVALAVRHAAEGGLLPEEALAPVTPGAAGLWEAVSVVKDLGERMSQATPATLPSANMALLLSEASLWTRYARTERGFETFVHAGGPETSDIVIVTDLSVLRALRNARLSVSAAIARNLLILEGAGGVGVEPAEQLLRAAYEGSASASTDLSARLPWSRAQLR
jgi:hypothetical protein